MYKVLKSFIFLFLINSYCYSQVINVESMRRKSDSVKWSGNASLNVSLIKNQNDIFRISTKAHIQYKHEKNLWLFINDLSFQQLDKSSFENNGTQHLRYNRVLTPKIKMEAFLQSQYDAIAQIDFRGLIGLGPRFKLNDNDDYRFYLGTLIMYEHEKASEVEAQTITKDFRGSSYLSFSLYPAETLSIISTSYYQPLIKDFDDYRFSSEITLLITIYEQLAFKTTFTYNYDAVPVTDVSKTRYELTNGLLYSF